MTRESLALPQDLMIRRLSEEEITEISGGAVSMRGITTMEPQGIHEFVLQGSHEERKVFRRRGEEAAEPHVMKSRFDRAILALRTFKTGYVGYSLLRVKPTRLCPIPLGQTFSGDHYVPFGRYELAETEADHLVHWVRLVSSATEPAMEMALHRLADAELRTRPQDRIVDAVIGMESLLLAGLRSEDRRGELKFRFSLHYSTLFETPEARLAGFRVAKDLYDLRSTIAHGSRVREPARVGSERLALSDAANRAVGALRLLVRRFLPEVASQPYKSPEFWEGKYFGIRPAEGR